MEAQPTTSNVHTCGPSHTTSSGRALLEMPRRLHTLTLHRNRACELARIARLKVGVRVRRRAGVACLEIAIVRVKLVNINVFSILPCTVARMWLD